MKICVAVSSLLDHDAIGNDVAHQVAMLKRNNITAYVYADHVARPAMASDLVAWPDLMAFIREPDNILIYHHGGYWGNGGLIIEMARCRIYLKYHNITPPEFFKPYTRWCRRLPAHERFCKKGLVQTGSILETGKVTRFLCDSRFNSGDFVSRGIEDARIRIVPPFHKLDDFGSVGVDRDLLGRLDDGNINVLFVGRLVPNKGHKDMIRVMAAYARMYDTGVRLFIIGGIDPSLKEYLKELTALIAENNLQQIVRIKGSVTFAQLHTYYTACHLFLLMSGHEGFCLPVLEAQYHDLPIVALGAGAVPEALGENQLVFDTMDYEQFAAAIHVIYHNPEFKDYLASQGKINIERFSNTTIEPQFLKAVLD